MTLNEDGSSSQNIEALPDAASLQQRKPRMLLWIVLGSVALVAVIALGAVLFVQAQKQQQEEKLADFRENQFARAAAGCKVGMTAYEIFDNGDSINFSRVTKPDGARYDEVHCFLQAVGAPESLETKIGQTRALDGTREGAWAEFAASWTYHPDDGLNILVERVGEPVLPESNS